MIIFYSISLILLISMGVIYFKLTQIIRRVKQSEQDGLTNHQQFQEQIIKTLKDVILETNTHNQLQKMAYHDPLTGLANRHKLDEQIKNILASAQRHHSRFAVLLLDLDHFKYVNDTVGHDAGDDLLQIVAERLKNTVRATDSISRLGGDEFVVIITDIKKLDEIILVAQKILVNLLKPIILKNHEFYVTTSMGISVYPTDGKDMPTLLKNADLALYRVKQSGRNNYQFCTLEMTVGVHKRLAMQQALKQALLSNALTIYYQPKMDIVNQRITGIEALARWDSLEYGSVCSEEIVSLAEETGLIVPISHWLLKTATEQVRSWQEAGFASLTLSVNLSGKQFKQFDFIETTLKILSENNFLPEFLELEITENLILQDPINTLKILQAIKKTGIRITIDNFGSGYSSLTYLKSVELDQIKIDKNLIQRITDEPATRIIISAIIGMANRLSIKTIAEGVETDVQYQFLVQEQCAEVQGYLVSPPLPVDLMQKFLRESAKKTLVIG